MTNGRQARRVRRANARANEAKRLRARGVQVAGAKSLIPLANPEALAKEIKREIAASFDGNTCAAAHAAGISEATLRRLVRGRQIQISLPTFNALYRLLPERRRPKWGAYVLPSNAQLAIVAYNLWLRAWRDRTQIEKGAGSVVIVGNVGAEWRGLGKEWDALLERVARVVPDVWNDLLALMSGQQYFVDRWSLALLRILEPLVDAHSSGGVERHHDELTDSELQRFVRAGFVREEILILGREGDLHRALRVHRIPPEPDTTPPSAGVRAFGAVPSRPRKAEPAVVHAVAALELESGGKT